MQCFAPLLVAVRGPVTAEQVDLEPACLIDCGHPARQLPKKPGKPLRQLLAFADVEDRLHRAMVLGLDDAEHGLANRRVGLQPGEFPGHVEVDVRQRLLDLVNDEPEQARVTEHSPEQGLTPRPTNLKKCLQPAAHPEPAGHEMAILSPGKHPGNGPEIGNGLGAEASSRPGAQVQQRNLLQRACQLVVG